MSSTRCYVLVDAERVIDAHPDRAALHREPSEHETVIHVDLGGRFVAFFDAVRAGQHPALTGSALPLRSEWGL